MFSYVSHVSGECVHEHHDECAHCDAYARKDHFICNCGCHASCPAALVLDGGRFIFEDCTCPGSAMMQAARRLSGSSTPDARYSRGLIARMRATFVRRFATEEEATLSRHDLIAEMRSQISDEVTANDIAGMLDALLNDDGELSVSGESDQVVLRLVPWMRRLDSTTARQCVREFADGLRSAWKRHDWSPLLEWDRGWRARAHNTEEGMNP